MTQHCRRGDERGSILTARDCMSSALRNCNLPQGFFMGRPPIHDRAMTAAERMRRYRARKREVVRKPRNINEALARMTKAQQAQYVGKSVRSWYYIGQYLRCRAFEWDGDILDGKHGRIAMAFIAHVCAHGGQ